MKALAHRHCRRYLFSHLKSLLSHLCLSHIIRSTKPHLHCPKGCRDQDGEWRCPSLLFGQIHTLVSPSEDFFCVITLASLLPGTFYRTPRTSFIFEAGHRIQSKETPSSATAFPFMLASTASLPSRRYIYRLARTPQTASANSLRPILRPKFFQQLVNMSGTPGKQGVHNLEA